MKTRILLIVTVALVIGLAAIWQTQNHKSQAPDSIGNINKTSGADEVSIQMVFAVRNYITDWF